MSHRAIHLSPSLLAADFGLLRESALAAIEAGADSLHIDIMDGHYVHNIAFGLSVFPALKPYIAVPLVAHLEIKDPDGWISDFAAAGADMIVVQEDTCPNLPVTITAIRAHGLQAGIGVNPDRTLARLRTHPHILEQIELLIVMGVYPGFGGQAMAVTTEQMIRDACALRDEAGAHFDIAVDGGVSLITTPAIVGAGASTLIAGSSVFAGDIRRNARELISAAESASDAL